MDFDPFCYFCSFQAAKNATVGGDLNLRFRMLLKSTVIVNYKETHMNPINLRGWGQGGGGGRMCLC